MGRPPKSAEEKRVQVNIRLLAADKMKLEALASESEKPLATEAESILAKHLSRRKEVNHLLDKIADQIATLEELAKGQFHKNLKAWAAVSEMLSRVIEDDNPEKLKDDEIVQDVRAQIMKYEDLRRTGVALLAGHGISVRVDPRPSPLLGYNVRRGLFGSKRQDHQSSRLWEQAAINAMPDDEQKEECQDLFNTVVRLDEEIAKLEAEEADAMRPLIEAEQEGRRLVTPPNALLGLFTPPNIKPYEFSGLLHNAITAAAESERDEEEAG
jgi:hypothetical protein